MKKDKEIRQFIKQGGRKGAKADFFKVLRKAITSPKKSG